MIINQSVHVFIGGSSLFGVGFLHCCTVVRLQNFRSLTLLRTDNIGHRSIGRAASEMTLPPAIN